MGREYLAGILLGLVACTPRVVPESLEVDQESDPDRSPAAAVPFAERQQASERVPAEPPPTEVEPSYDEPVGPKKYATPRFKVMRGWMESGHHGYETWSGDANRCPAWVGARGVPSISTDGTELVHAFGYHTWYSDGGEFWWDYEGDEPHGERGGVLVELAGMKAEPLRVLAESEVTRRRMRHAEAEQVLNLIDCDAYEQELVAGVDRLNARLGEHQWRALSTADELGIDVGGSDDGQTEVPAAQRAVEVVWRNGALVFRVPGVAVLHREPTEHPEHEYQFGALYLDLQTGAGVVELLDYSVCFGQDTELGQVFVLPPKALEQIRKRIPSA